MPLDYVLLFSLLGSVGALTGAGALLAFPGLHQRLKTPLLAYAVGTLLGATFIGLLPEAIEKGQSRSVCLITLAGLFGFFLLEKIMRLPHTHGQAGEAHHLHRDEHRHLRPAGALILVGDAFHNFVDGVVIAVAFSSSLQLGILTALAVIAHEIPQELGDFVILLESGWHRWKAYWMNFLSSMTTVVGALFAYFALEAIRPRLPVFLAISASSFLYIAMVDLVPILHHDSGYRGSIAQMSGLLLGAGTVLMLHGALG